MILNNASDVRRGTNLTEYVYRGSTLVWQRKHPHPDPYVPVPNERHYGVKMRGYNGVNEFEYLYDAVGKQPMSISTTGDVSLGGWSTAFFVVNNYPCMLKYNGDEDYKLNPADVRYKLDGSSSDYNNYSYGGNAMSCFNCHIWIKFYYEDDWFYIEVSDEKLDNDFVDYPYIRSDGSHSEKMYYPLYSGTFDSSNRLRSIGAGGIKKSISTHENLVAAAESNGNGWQIKSFAFMLWVDTLLALMLGGGNAIRNLTETGAAASDAYQNGWSYNRGQFNYLRPSSSGGYVNNNVHNTFYCEWLWGGRSSSASYSSKSYDVFNGIYYKCYHDNDGWNPHICYKMYPPYTTDKSTTGYSELPLPLKSKSELYKTAFSMNKNCGIMPDKNGKLFDRSNPTISRDAVEEPFIYYEYGFSGNVVYPHIQDNSAYGAIRITPYLYYTALTSSVFYV